MALVATLLAASERVYCWLVKIYPKNFRAEHENEMTQNFKDLCREQLDQLSPARMMGLWGHTFLDLTTSAAIEHIRRKEPMTALDRDLRWDVRYGVQMLFKHSLWLLKYTAMALIGGAVAIVLAAWIWSGVRIWQKEKPVSDAWQMLTGKTPEGYFQAALQQFPKSGMNETARQLEELTTRLGIFNPMPNRLYDGQRKNLIGPFDTVDAPTYVLSQTRTPADNIDDVPVKLREYLRSHRADLDALYNLIQRTEIPRWETDITQLSRAPVPGLFYHRQLHGLIALDILDKTRKEESAAAQTALEVSWKINQSLWERPELLSQMVALSILDLQAGLLRKMGRVPDLWQRRIGLAMWQESVSHAMEFDAILNSRDMSDPSPPVRTSGGFDLLMNSLFGKPLRRLVGVEILEVGHEALSLIRRSNFCAMSPQAAVEQLESSHSSWNLGTHFGYTNYLRTWSRVMEVMAHLELTANVLQTKEALNFVASRDRPKEAAEAKSVLCSEARWVHEVTPEGAIQIQCVNLPDWLTKDHPQSAPLKYSLKGKS